jgi:DNA replication and repair protein RecF
MQLTRLSLLNFKNYPQSEVDFGPGFNCITGNNGIGKTNLLDAVYYLSFCKSAINVIDNQNISIGAPFFVIQGFYTDESGAAMEIYCGLKRSDKKQFKLNKKEYPRLSDHIGKIPLVFIRPEDTELITGQSDVRRKFMDSIISQYDREYLENLLIYNRILKQRNQLLKNFSEQAYFDPVALEIYDEQLSSAGDAIFKSRNSFFDEFNQLFAQVYKDIAGNSEEVSISLVSHLVQESMGALLRKNIDRDRASQHTLTGIHRDDLDLNIRSMPAWKFASQGQQKTMVVSMRIAQFIFLHRQTGKSPILMLDDIYDKLDESRMLALLNMCCIKPFGQVLITDTHHERIPLLLNSMKIPFNSVKPVNSPNQHKSGYEEQ